MRYLALLLGVLLTQPALGSDLRVCSSNHDGITFEDVSTQLAEEFNEFPTATYRNIDAEMGAFKVMFTSKSGEWTLIQVESNGHVCVLQSGIGYTPLTR